MADYRKILVLLLEGRSYRDVVEIAGCSHRAVARVSQEIQARGVTAADSVSDADLAGWFPDGRRKVSEEYDQPDLSRVLAS
ncbi:IS21 family transposase, partial [Cryobacterium sp. 10S3]|nr:IS21 family transposase [Cryobacterium sp. 10S3]